MKSNVNDVIDKCFYIACLLHDNAVTVRTMCLLLKFHPFLLTSILQNMIIREFELTNVLCILSP